MANIVVSGCSFELANGTYIDQEDGTWRKIVPVESDPGGFVEIFFFAPTNLWYLQGNAAYSTAPGGTAQSDPTSLNWSNSVKLAFEVINPTFGLPAAAVALIESRFRTVANYLRLRNQGQV